MKRFSLFTILFALLSGFIFFSCEVGLGEAVDTEAPKITIDYPESKAIVRDSFVLAGTCSDDIAVTKVVVSILDEENKTVTGYDFKQPVVETTIDEKQFWSVPLNEKLQDGTYPLKDGKYTFRAVAYDGAGRKSGELERDLEIDNTAPVFIINSPGSILTESSFGSVFKIEGSIAENHTVKEMNLTVFDDAGNKIAEWQQENINTAGGTTVTFAKYYSDSEKQDPLFDRYKEIYGDSSGFKSFSCSVKLMDNALVYKKPDFVPSYNDGSRGEIDTGTNYNTTTNLWLYDDIYGTDAKFKLMGTAASAEWGKSFEIKDFMNYLNGTDSYEKKNSSGKSVVEVLNEAEINTEDTRLKFKLNKDANPTYTIMGYSFDSTAQTEGIYSLSPAAKGGTITFKADAGLDGVLFSPSTIKVYMFGPFEAIQVSSALSEIYSSPDIYASAPENQKITTKLYDGENGIPGADKDVAGPYEGESRTTWTQSLNLPSDSTIMKATKYYIIAASGCDKDNVDMISLNYKYNGFIAQATGVPPTVTIEEPEKDSISNAENEILIFKGDVVSEEGTAINDVSYEITVYDTLEKNKFLGTIKNIDSEGNRNNSLKIEGTLGESPSVSFEIDALNGFWQSADGISLDGTNPPLNSAYKYTITVTGLTDTKGIDSISVTLDKKLPTAEIEVSSLLSNGVEENCVNGFIKIKGTVSDNDKISSAWAEISDSAGNVTKSDVQPEGTGSFTWDFDTTLLNDKTEYSVTVYALDRAGNKNASAIQKIYVDQNTDLPVITLSNADKTFNGKPSLSSNLFGMGSNVLIGAVSDDDGIASIDYVIDEDKGENAIRGTIDMAGKTPTSKSFQIDIAQLVKDKIISSGDHTLSISATDISSGLKNVSTPVKSSEETGVSKMAFGYDDDVPSLSVTTKSGEFIGEGISYSIIGTASDGSGLKKDSEGKSIIYRYAKTDRHENYGTEKNPEPIPVLEDGTWTDTIETDGNGDEFEYRAEDEYERSTTAKFTFKIDSVKPTIKIAKPTEATVYIGETTLCSFRGTADDYENDYSVDSSGIAVIEYTVYALNGNSRETKTVDSSNDWNININFADYKPSEASEIDVSKIEFRSVDNGGLKSEPVSRNIVIDKVAPSIKFTIDGIEKNGTETLYINEDPEFIFEVSDENLKFDSISCSLPLTWNLLEQTETYVKYKISGFAAESVASQSKNYSFTAEDKSGRITERTLNVYCDKDFPVIAEPSISPIASKEGDTTEYVNGFVTLKGTVSDIDKVQSTKIILQQNGSDVTSGDTLILVNNTGDRYEYKIDTTKLDDALLDIIIESTDRAGNLSSETKTVTVDQETDNPVLKFSNGDVTITDENAIQVGTNLFGMGSNTLYINVSDDDGIQSVLLNVDGNSEELLTDGKSTTWSTSKDVSKYGSGVHSLKFTITDTEGKTVSYPENGSDTIKIAFDDDVPSVSVIKFNEVTYTEGCFAPADFTLNGTVKDSSGTVKIYYKGETETKVAEIGSCTESQNWTHDISGETSGNNKTRTYVARDKYGRESSVTIKYNVDTISPVFISDYISITGETSKGSQSYKVNNYTASDVWFTNSSFTIKGTASGENKPVVEINDFTIQLKVGNEVVSTLQPGANNSFSGTVEVDITEASYSKTITLIATDAAGNKSSPLNITVNVDKDSPAISVKNLYTENPNENSSAQPLTDGSFVNKDKLYFKFEVSDSVSGVSKVEVYKTAAMKDLIKKYEIASPSKGNVEQVIELDISSFDSKEYDFYVKVTDKAENTISSDLANFTFDKTAPTVTYSKPAASSDVNKTISIEGTISDLNPPSENSGWNWTLKVKKPGASSFTEVESYTFDTSVSVGAFKVSGIDTTKIGEGNAEFLVIATDKAGNTISELSGKILTLNINQDSDRPVISLNTISTDGNTTLSSGTIAGTVSDDDGVNTLEIQVVKKNASVSDSGWEKVTLNGANWSYTYSDGNNAIDGDYKLYFRITDNAGGVFTSSDTELADPNAKLSCPKINYSGQNEVCSAVSFSIDTNPPGINIVQYRISSDSSAWSAWTILGQNTIFGGVEKRYVQFRLEAHDTVTAQENLVVSVNISGTDKKFSTADGTIKLNSTGEQYNYNGDYYYYFETNVIDAYSEITTGSYTLGFDVRDKAEKPSTQSYQIRVDNTAPDSITIRGYSETTELTGNIVLSGLCSDESKGNSGVKELYYAIPKNTISAPENISGSAEFGEQWETANLEASGMWEIAIKPEALCEQNGTSGITVKDGFKGYETSSNSGVFNLPLWFKIVDNVGNSTFKTENHIRYNPDADKPRVSITYPVHNVKDSARDFSYVVMGGTVRFTGTATDDEGIEGVYLQFDMDGDGEYENGKDIGGCPYDYNSTVVPIPPQFTEFGVKANGTQSWNYSLKISSLEGLLYSSENNYKTLNVRVVAVDTGDDKQLVGAWSEPIHISVNKDIPAFETVKISQYDTNTPTQILKTVDYEDDKFISGENWYLIGKVSSNAGISSVEVTDSSGNDIGKIEISTSGGTISITDNNNYILTKKEENGQINELEYKIPVTGENKWAIKITVADNSEEKKSNYSNYSLNIDNTPPVFYDVRPDSEISKYGTIKIYSGEYGSGGQILDDVNKIQNSNGMFTLAGRTTEAGSGYENILFYFKRVPENVTAQNPVRVYNPMKAHGATNKENRTDITVDSATDGKVYFNSDGLPVLYSNNVTRSEDNKFSLTSDYVKNNDNIRVGGLVKIGGLYRKISSVESSSGTVTFDSECETSYTEAEFVYAMVIDNSGESLNNDNSIKNDDGDGMVESYSKSGTNYTWDAAFDSNNIPDGPIELHIVAFDKAGNSNHGYVKTAVSNNAPRIARVRLATDLNGNSTYEDNEKQVFAYLDTDTLEWAENTKSKGTEIWNLDGKVNGSVWTIKNTLQVEPEFVGGTAPFHYIFTKESGTGDAKNLSSPKTGTATGQISQNKEAFVISNGMLDSSDSYEDKTNTYQFSFWDSTEETEPCTDSQWTVLNIQLKQDIIDNFAPKVAVKPFYWNNAGDNSLYENSLDNGHIELEADLNFENTSFTESNGEYDKDPKVSGKIVFRGTAYDDVRLSSLWIKFTDFTFSNYVTEAGYGTDGTSDGYVQAAFYNIEGNSWKVPSATLDDDGWTFEAEDEYFDQKGHKVNWTLTIDTSRIAKVAAVDIEFKAMAVDHVNTDAHKSSDTADTSALDDNVYNKPTYRVDVVPYITGLDTVLTDLEVLNPSVYGRSALGKYPVYYYRKTTSGGVNAEKIIVKGFNISGGTVTFNGAATGTIDGSNAISIPDTAKSGEISIAVNNVSSLNNKNADVEYNLQPNGQNNNILTDNVELAIWEINSKAAVSKTGELSEVVMHVNPANGMLGFAFAHSQDLASYPNGRTSSYQTWMTDWTGVNQIGFIYDQKGNMYGTNGGTDTYTPSKKTGRFGLISSFWGTIATDSGNGDNITGYTGNKRLRLEYLGYWGKNPSYASNVNRFAKGDCSQFATTDNGNYTNLYIIYYDNTLGELKFRAGSYDTVNHPVPNGGCFSKGSVSFGDFADDAYNATCENRNNYNPTYAHTSIISNVTSGANGNSNAKPGTYYSIAAVKGAASDESGNVSDVVSVVWYDETNKSLWYSYIENPLQNAGNRDANGAVSTEWAKPVPLLTGNAGESCAIAADTDGHIHIAAYSRSNAGSLYYIYLDEYNSAFDPSKNLVKVDSYGSTGQYITMEVAKDSKGNNIPYIGYWMNSMSYPKYTYLVDTSSSEEGADYYPKAGVDDLNLYTGAWESIMLPTSSAVLRDDINIGLYRYLADEGGENGHKKGEIREIPQQQNENAGTVNGIAGGNGTSNPVLAYGIAETGAGYIETAQLK